MRTGSRPSWSWLIGIPLLALGQLLLVYGLAVTIASLNLFFRDLERLTTLVVTFLFFLTPIVYSESMIPAKYHALLYLNPAAPLILSWRDLFLSGRLDWTVISIGYLYATVAFVVGSLIYTKVVLEIRRGCMIAVRFEHVSKSYPIYSQILTGLKASLLHAPQTLQRFRRHRFMALNDVSFEVEQGESVGLIGSNGSGKSTTLALIAGVLRAQSGRVEVRGRVCPLLELGAGFHPELTGRENIFLNGILLGLTRREVVAKLDEIVAFSELEPFLDQPIRTYSSGMIARLGFSVAAHLDPEILLIDEILAVGDLRFQAKCRDKVEEFKKRQVTVILVSHSLAEVCSFCKRAIWLKDGKMAANGEPSLIIPRYEEATAQEIGRGAGVSRIV